MARTTENKASSSQSLMRRMSNRFGVDADKLQSILKATAFRQKGEKEITNEQLAALLVVAEQYNLNPFTKEIYAFPDKNNGIVPVVGVDGWSRIVNEHKQYDGEEFRYSPDMIIPDGTTISCPEWIECVMYRKDRSRPTVIREYLDEVYKPPHKGTNERGREYVINGPWQTHPKRFLRHKSFIQCARIALGFTGIYDEDEANRIIDMGTVVDVSSSHTLPALEQAKVDPIVDELIRRAKELNSWSASSQYLMQNFQGREFAYAHNKLKAAEAEHLRSQSSEEKPAGLEVLEEDRTVQQAAPPGFKGEFEDAEVRNHDSHSSIDHEGDFALYGGEDGANEGA